MTKEQCDFICEALECCEMTHQRYDGYSGRGMYGERTYGVVVPHPLDIASAVVGYVKGLSEDSLKDIPQLDDLKMDNMAKEYIIY